MEHFVVGRGRRASSLRRPAAERLIRAFRTMCQQSKMISVMNGTLERGGASPAAARGREGRKGQV
jgi:hypothetical protein